MAEQTITNQTPATYQNDQNKPLTIQAITKIDKLRHKIAPNKLKSAKSLHDWKEPKETTSINER